MKEEKKSKQTKEAKKPIDNTKKTGKKLFRQTSAPSGENKRERGENKTKIKFLKISVWSAREYSKKFLTSLIFFSHYVRRH